MDLEDKKRKLYKGRELKDFRELVSRYENEYSDKIAFTYKENPKAKEHINISYSKFVKDIKGLGTSLIHLGLSDKRVAIISSNRYEWCVSYLAVTTSNMVVVPLDKALPSNEIVNLIKRSDVEAIIFDKVYLDTILELKNSDSTNLKYLICMDNIENPAVELYTKLLDNGTSLIDNGDDKYENVKIDANKMSIMLFTSGTTSISKAVSLSQSNICSDIYALSQMTDIRKEDIFLSFLPLHHTFESTCTFLYGTSCGITVAFCDGLRYVASNLKEFNITGFVSVPLVLEVMYKKLLKGIEEQGKTSLVNCMFKVSNFLFKCGIDIRRKIFKPILANFAPNLRVLIAGGAPMNKNAIECFVGLGINLLQGYGLTETSPVLAGENDKYKRAGSVGFPLPGITVEIDNPNEHGIGEIKAKGPTIMEGYYGNSEATKEVLKDGWFYTGDLGYIDDDGYLFVTGRKKDVIVLKNGKNIYPEELEILINKLPYVAESLVFGKPDNKKDDLILCAKIVYNKDVMKEMFKDTPLDEYHDIIWKDIKLEVNKSMPAYKSIRDIIVTDEPLIKTTTQKVKRFEEIKKILGE